MKLDNRGWGTKEMIIMSSILFFLLLVVTVLIYSFYHNMDMRPFVYSELEANLRSSAVRYANDNNVLVGQVTSDELEEEGYLTGLYDKKNRKCNGYVVIDSGTYNTYIKCRDYTTSNY